jgi:molybdopterin-guanine dinucleotide biosynthesis protein A
MEGAIVAGGKSSRMGYDKALLEWEGNSLIQIVVETVSAVCDKLIIIADNGERFLSLGLEIYPDKISGMGPLGGIYTALEVSEGEKVFCVGCDMPFLDAGVIRGMLDISEEYDVVVPYLDDGFHPLHAVYSRNCIKPIRDTLESASPRVTGFFDRVRVRTVGEDDFPTLSYSLTNLNTPADLEKYLAN